ncbi:hypothetical protein ASC87_27245 [Rhizobacter sp. Root1221]|nr:hypothetical protein ASC87_27245 [Rhizobacter sp. Root1221]
MLSTLSLTALASEPINKLNLCSRTQQTLVQQVDPSIVEAASSGDVARVLGALQAGVSPNSTDSEGFSLLHAAITENQDAILDLLLKWGVDVNQPFMGSSPLSLARTSAGGDNKASGLRRIAKLVKAGAELSDFDNAFFTVIKFGFKSIPDGFVDSIARGDMRRLELYVRATLDINEQIADGISPLHVAAIQGTPEVIRYLVKCGADVNSRTERGAPVLWFAKDRPQAKRVLVELGATEMN